jgi:class 3 adenylate cyclase
MLLPTRRRTSSGIVCDGPSVSTLEAMERKLATVLFVDLVDSTALLSGVDPEVARRRVTEFFDQVTRCVISHGGIVEKFAGDAVLAGFGVAQAHEDDAERAVRAALAILEEVERMGLQARIGIESGEVVVEQAESTFATGEAVNLAARLQQAAGPGEILIGPGAQRLTLECLDLEPLEPLQIRGWNDPLRVWRVAGAREQRTTA